MITLRSWITQVMEQESRMGPMHRALLALTLVIAAGSPFATAAEGDAPLALTEALEQQQTWLKGSGQAEGWDRYLKTDQLQSELAQGSEANRRTVAQILGRYGSGTAGLHSRHFVETREKIAAWADTLGIPHTVRWAERLRAAALATGPVEDSAVEAAREELLDSTGALNEMLQTADDATEAGWKSFLKWDQLEAQLALGSPNWKALEAVGAQYFNGHRGLEYPEFVRVRNALRKYLYLGSLGSNGKGQKTLASNLGAVADALERYNKQPSTKSAAEVATLLNWVEQLGRAGDIADEIRAAHNLPNIKIRIAESLLQRRFSREVDKTTPVDEMILTTHVRGQSITTGKVTMDIVANPNVATIDIVFRGSSRTRSVGRNKPVTIRSTSSTALEARKPLYVYPSEVSSAPTKANGSTHTTIHSITPDGQFARRFISKMAWSKAMQQKPQTEAIAARRAARRLERQIDDESQALLTRAQQTLREQLRGPINRRGLIPEKIRSYSTDHQAVALFTQANDAQFGATTEPPMFCPHDDVVAQVHESAINNTAEKAIAGLTLTDERIAELAKELTGSVPEELQIREDEQPWSISFDWQQPMTVEFDDQRMKVAIRGRRFTSGERELNKVMEMAATYTMETAESGVIMRREGEIEVTFPTNRDEATLSARERVFRTLMQKKFGGVFKPLIEGDGFTLPGRFENLGRIRLNDLSTENGWLSLGWK